MIHREDNFKKITWQDFEKCISTDSELYIFGAAPLANIFFMRYSEKYNISGVVDNDKKKQGKKIAELLGLNIEGVVQSPSILKSVPAENLIIIVCSKQYSNEIAEELYKQGITNIFPVFYMEANKNGGRIDLIEENTAKEISKKFIKEEIDNRKIVVYMGTYGDHGKAITKELLRRKTDVDIVWILRKERNDIPTDVRTVYETNWKDMIYELETAKIWIYDVMIPSFIIKRYEQKYIQVKHWSGLGIKKFNLDASNYSSSDFFRSNGEYNSQIMDYIFSASDLDEEMCRSGFGFKGTFIRTGSARSDVLFSEAGNEKVRKYYDLKKDIKLLLYAPTFRDKKDGVGGELGSIDIDYKELNKALSNRFGGEWRIIVRLHPSISSFVEQNVDADVIDASFYQDSQELVAASDILITDYSSMAFEPAYVYKPVFLFALDKEEYLQTRSTQMDYDSLPFPISTSNEQLMEQICSFDENAYKERLKSFFDKYGVKEDGHSSERAVDFIEHLLKD